MAVVLRIQRSLADFINARDDHTRADSAQTAAGYALRIRRKKALELFDQPGGKVLDVGCGPASMTGDLLKLGCRFWGVDRSERMIDICRKRFGESDKTHFMRATATQMAFPQEFFDAVLCIGVTDSMPDPVAAIDSMLQVLRPGGTLIVSFSNLKSPYGWWKATVVHPVVASLRSLLRPAWGSDRPWDSPHLYTEEQARALFASSGVEIEATIPYFFNVLLSPTDEIWPRGSVWLTRTLEEGRWRVPKWVAAGFLFRVRKRE